ncbi:MAG TPA: four helix bundle protein, partial [Pirellulaceae bacterium]|nr:four helix bundle protein [Pirellulaceae bacterium]
MADKRHKLRRRLTEFALAIIDLVQMLPDDPQHRLLLTQLMRSSSCLSANYNHACCSQSLTWFCNELARAETLAAETLCWLDLVAQRRLVDVQRLVPLRQES